MINDPGGKFDEVMDFRATLSPESDRGCALIAASYIDAELEKLLFSAVVDDKKVARDMFGQGKAVGSFSTRIDLAYLLGLVSLQDHRDMHLIRKIRNEFGHDHSPIKFTSPKIASRCAELVGHPFEKGFSPRRIFMATSMTVLAGIHIGMIGKRRPEVRPATSMDWAWYSETDIKPFVSEAVELYGDDRKAIRSYVMKRLGVLT